MKETNRKDFAHLLGIMAEEQEKAFRIAEEPAETLTPEEAEELMATPWHNESTTHTAKNSPQNAQKPA